MINIIGNKERKTVTVIIGDVHFYSAKYLLEKYQDSKYFGEGILKISQEEMVNILKKITIALNEVNPNVKIKSSMLFKSDTVPYAIFGQHFDINGDWDKNFSLFLNSKCENGERNFFFEDLAKTKKVLDESTVKGHTWGVEIEIATKLDEATLESKIFVILHRIIKSKKLESNFRTNDDAWAGFDFGEKKEVVEETIEVEDHDLPF